MKTQSSETPIRSLPLPENFIIPLKQHIGQEGELCVNVGDRLLKGQPLTFGTGNMLPVHAPTSGHVEAVNKFPTQNATLAESCIFFIPDGKDQNAISDTVINYRELSRENLITRLHHAGIAGLGGAGFPTPQKLAFSGIHTLMVNAVECEPCITADDRLMREHADDIIEGCRILARVLHIPHTIIGIEEDKPAALSALQQALLPSDSIQICVIPAKYPSGGARQLIKILTGKEVPRGRHATETGILIQNVGTIFAIKRSIIDGEPLIKRVVTVTGEGVKNPGNWWVRLGTPIEHLLHYAGFQGNSATSIIVGGPLMGTPLSSLHAPVVKTMNCLVVLSPQKKAAIAPEGPCIRCGLCAEVCPVHLLPQQLYWYSKGADHERARAWHLEDCIECAACSYVCPANIPLVQYYRQEKMALHAQDEEMRRIAESKARFEAKQARLARENAARQARQQQLKENMGVNDKAQIAAALERVKAKKQQIEQKMQPQEEEKTPSEITSVDPRKAALDAIIARAKSRQNASKNKE